jgi:hypothetical protein
LTMLRWILQISVMLCDLVILAACVMAAVGLPFFISLPLIYITYKVWRRQGGPMAWTKEGREKFLHNAKELGI